MFDWLKRRGSDSGLTAIGLMAEGVCIARVDWQGGQRPKLSHSAYQPWEEGVASERQLQRLAGQFQLKHARCTTLLDESEYALLLTEAPDVRPEELKTALRWRVKDLIDFHINDATLDVFELPGVETGGRVREMYAVAARNEAIRRRADQLQTAGINLDVIDIPEMAQRNLAALLPEDAQGVAVMSFGNRSGLLTITRQGELYLSRVLDVGLDHLVHAEGQAGYYDRVVLEVQRSLDYYESHFRQRPVQHLVLAPAAAHLPELLGHLRANLGVSVSVMNLAELVEMKSGIPPELEGPCLFALGAALRREEKAL
jgi:MSHA biogenesis protein MshI